MKELIAIAMFALSLIGPSPPRKDMNCETTKTCEQYCDCLSKTYNEFWDCYCNRCFYIYYPPECEPWIHSSGEINWDK